ncbi:MAG: DUF4783 domain-containing protein [Bacteroidota bacterium]|nr:DUF4783 domain-containing protein [Bacteroidota bacterium]
MKLFFLPLIILCYWIPVVATADPADKIAELIRQGNIHELSKLFTPTVEITILDDENVYSKDQAEIVLEKFFNQYKPNSVKILHNIASNPVYRFEVIIVTTQKGIFRIAYTLKETDGNLMLIDMRIEREKV